LGEGLRGVGYAGGDFHGGIWKKISMKGVQDFLAFFKEQ